MKRDYAKEVQEFVENGGKIKQAVNSNKVLSFNNPNSALLDNQRRRKLAKSKGEKTYKLVLFVKPVIPQYVLLHQIYVLNVIDVEVEKNQFLLRS